MSWFKKEKASADDKMGNLPNAVIVAQETTAPQLMTDDEKIESMLKNDMQDTEFEVSNECSTLPVENISIINSDTELLGDIDCEHDLIIYGNVKGRITCASRLTVYGVIHGPIVCGEGILERAIILGDIQCSGNLIIDSKSTINGDIDTFSLTNAGRIKGDAYIHDSVRFSRSAAIMGNIQAQDIEIERGAVIQGTISMLQEIKFDD